MRRVPEPAAPSSECGNLGVHTCGNLGVLLHSSPLNFHRGLRRRARESQAKLTISADTPTTLLGIPIRARLVAPPLRRPIEDRRSQPGAPRFEELTGTTHIVVGGRNTLNLEWHVELDPRTRMFQAPAEGSTEHQAEGGFFL